MMGATKNYYINTIKKIIAQDPCTVKITRKVQESDGYGGFIYKTKEIKFTGIVYSRNSANKILSEKGIYFSPTEITQKLLCLSSEDVQEGDIFKHNDRLLKVNFVNDYFGICKQCELITINKDLN